MVAADTQFWHIHFSGKVTFCEAFGTDVLYAVFTSFREDRKSIMKLTLNYLNQYIFIQEQNIGRHCIWNLALDQTLTFSPNCNGIWVVIVSCGLETAYLIGWR